jgi:hypothetical protein
MIPRLQIYCVQFKTYTGRSYSTNLSQMIFARDTASFSTSRPIWSGREITCLLVLLPVNFLTIFVTVLHFLASTTFLRD